jgi:hypothetical protein
MPLWPFHQPLTIHLMAVVDESLALSRVRRLIRLLVAFGMLGTSVELLLLAHTEDTNQLMPFIAMVLSLLALIWRTVSGSPASVRAVQFAMALMLIAGAVGVVLHYRANMEFQLDIDPSLGGFTLFKTVLEAKSPPALAPGNMALLGLFGLVSVYRDPALQKSS